MAEWGKNFDSKSMKQINIGLATNSSRDLVAFEVFSGSISDTTTLIRFVHNMNHMVPGCRIIMNHGLRVQPT